MREEEGGRERRSKRLRRREGRGEGEGKELVRRITQRGDGKEERGKKGQRRKKSGRDSYWIQPNLSAIYVLS